MKIKRMVALGTALAMAFSLSGCGGSEESGGAAAVNLPSIDSIELGTDYQDITASIKILTNRTDIVDTVYKGYADQFMKLYPNITVEYEAITDYEESLNLRLPTGDWGDICYIPTSVAKSEMSEYFSPLGDFATLNEIYNFLSDKNYGGIQYGIPNGGTAGGLFITSESGKRRGLTSCRQPRMSSWIVCRRSKIIPTQFRFIPILPPAGRWEPGISISE